MNGIIHTCSHPNDSDPHFRISEADIFKNIFHYIEVCFCLFLYNDVKRGETFISSNACEDTCN